MQKMKSAYCDTCQYQELGNQKVAHLSDPAILALFSANSSAGKPGKNFVESFIVGGATLGGCILDRGPECGCLRSGGGGGSGSEGRTLTSAAAPAAKGLLCRPVRYCGTCAWLR